MIKNDIGIILRKLCEFKGVEIIEANMCKDVSIPPKLNVFAFMGHLKGKSLLQYYSGIYYQSLRG